MARLSQKEFMDKLKTFIGDRTDDEAISFIEDCKDTISEDKDDWKGKYDALVKEKDELDKEWRKKYTDRFFAPDSHNETDTNTNHENNTNTNPANRVGSDEPDEEQQKLEQAEKVRINDLFKPAES